MRTPPIVALTLLRTMTARLAARRPLAAVLALAAALAPAAHAATITEADLARPEGARHYLLALPGGAPAHGRPLVVVLHGHGGSGAQALGRKRSAAPLSVWLDVADREGLVIVAPDGIKGADGQPGWNDCRDDAANNPHSDDVAFIRALIEQVAQQQQVDRSRIYVMGMSNGGVMAFRLASELGLPLAGIAAASASMAARSACPAPRRATSVLILGGTADPLMPYAGGDVRFLTRKSRGAVIGAEATAAVWRRLAGLPDAPAQTQDYPHRDPGDPTHATRITWGADPARVQVSLLRVSGGGHVEPSLRERYRAPYLAIVGPQGGDFEAVEEVWGFWKGKKARD